MDIKGAIFDVDGTLLDSMPAWNHVVEDYLNSIGKPPREGVREELNRMGGNQLLEYLRTCYDVAGTDREILDGINRMLEDFYFNHAPLKPGVRAVLDDLRGRGVKMCVCTATDRYLVEAALKRCGIDGYFERIYTRSEERIGKSNPEMFHRAVAFLQTPLDKTAVFEDSLYAVKTAKETGLPVIAVHDAFDPDSQDKMKAIADSYYITLEDWHD